MSDYLVAAIETEARDCDGIHSYSGERRALYGEDDYDFYNRVLSEFISPHAEYGSLTIVQRDGFPEFVWRESTEEGYDSKYARFYSESEPETEDGEPVTVYFDEFGKTSD